MTQESNNVHFWNCVLHIAESTNAAKGPEAKKILLDQLTTLNEAFSDCDPVENYEAYVVLKMSEAMTRVIESDKVD
ncbi:MAG: hypothetical protein ACSHXZ_10600 [Gammaproteobacteria bacterium]